MKNLKNNLRYSLYLLLTCVLFSWLFQYMKNEMIFIGDVYENEQMVHVMFVFPENERINGDTLFIIATNDTLLTCRDKNGGMLYMRRLYER